MLSQDFCSIIVSINKIIYKYISHRYRLVVLLLKAAGIPCLKLNYKNVYLKRSHAFPPNSNINIYYGTPPQGPPQESPVLSRTPPSGKNLPAFLQHLAAFGGQMRILRTTMCSVQYQLRCGILLYSTMQCGILLYLIMQCGILLYTATFNNTVRHTAIFNNTLQYTAVFNNTLRYTTVFNNAVQLTTHFALNAQLIYNALLAHSIYNTLLTHSIYNALLTHSIYNALLIYFIYFTHFK